MFASNCKITEGTGQVGKRVFPNPKTLQQQRLPRRNVWAGTTLGYDKLKVLIFLCCVRGSESGEARSKQGEGVGEKINIGNADSDLRVCRGSEEKCT